MCQAHSKTVPHQSRLHLTLGETLTSAVEPQWREPPYDPGYRVRSFSLFRIKPSSAIVVGYVPRVAANSSAMGFRLWPKDFL
jgi:hypothetical protein